MSAQCPLCGRSEDELRTNPARMLGSEVSPTAWRAHLESCKGGDETRAIAVAIPFQVIRPVSMETNHVTYRNDELGLEYRFYYPAYLDRKACEDHIARVEAQPARLNVEGGESAQLPANTLCHALMEWRGLRNGLKTTDWSYAQYKKLKDEVVRIEHSKISYRFRRWWKRFRYGKNPPIGVKAE